MAPRLAALVLIGLAASCGGDAAQSGNNAASAPGAQPAAPANTAGAGNAAAASPAAAPCAFAPEVALDRSSFVRGDLPAFTAERLEAMRTSAGAAFARAAAAACGTGEIPQARLAAVRRLLVQSASGADNVAFYEDAESQPPGTLVFQWVFAEADLALPDQDDISEGLACWASPERAQCAEREP